MEKAKNSPIDSLRLVMQEKGLDAVLLTDEQNQFYLADFAYTDGYFLLTQKSAYLLTDLRYQEEAEKKAREGVVVLSDYRPLSLFLSSVLEEEKLKNIGLEDNNLSYAGYQSIQKNITAEFLPLGDMLARLRAVKSLEEIERLKQAQAITDKAFSHIVMILEESHARMTEVDVALELEFFMRKHGAEALAFPTIAVSGDASALPHGQPRHQALKRGFLTMDFGCKVRGYASDMTRTVYLGRASLEEKKLYNTVLAAQKEAINVIEAGMYAKDVDTVARNIIEASGYKNCFGHGLGHGVGLEVHEKPNLSPRSEQILEVGHVVTVEPGIYIKGKYGCRIEDFGVVTEKRFQNFTKSTKELLEIG